VGYRECDYSFSVVLGGDSSVLWDRMNYLGRHAERTNVFYLEVGGKYADHQSCLFHRIEHVVVLRLFILMTDDTRLARGRLSLQMQVHIGSEPASYQEVILCAQRPKLIRRGKLHLLRLVLPSKRS
jgi:hypothetical protein